MPKKPNPDCQLCAQHSADWAQVNFAKCWDAKENRCHSKRSYYRRKQKESAPPIGSAPAATVIVPVLLQYRHGNRLHAIGGRLEQGETIICAPAPVHVEGWTEGQVKRYAAELLEHYSLLAGQKFVRFNASFNLPALPCSIPNCLLMEK
jgi:hypothetical protein